MSSKILRSTLVTLTVLGLGAGCAGLGGSAVKYKAKKASPLHHTALEKAEKKIDKAERKIEKSRDDGDGLLKR